MPSLFVDVIQVNAVHIIMIGDTMHGFGKIQQSFCIDSETLLNLAESVHRITYHYNVECIDLYDIHKSRWHPDVQGQKDIADQVLEYLASENL